ncbi:MAG TPA: tryptophan 7-halogenase [Pyrinomonadaceae bacterium]|jgi:flavin-dependent dehydrogenase
MKTDVAIIGGGPAGSAAAIVLAGAGLRVALIERTTYDTERIGETFPPEICVPLQQLGVWEQFKNAGHLESPGIVSCWGSPQPYENDFLFNPYGCGWHVNRALFDRMLADAARQAGASLFLATSVQHCTQEADGRWVVEAKHKDGKLKFFADYVIEARGRAGGLTQGINRCLRLDRLVGCAAFFNMTDALSSNEARAVIEACPEGWWYSSGLPGNVLILAFMTDADLIPSAQEKALEYFYERLQESELTRSRLGQLIAPNVFRRFAADSCLRVAVSKNWLATGDAAMTFDPLSSQGVLKALVSGQSAAKAVLAAQSGSQTALQEYADTLTRGFQSYMDTRLQYYSAEQRWPTSPFWRRRHHAQFSGRGKQL